jgi:hypothetical protein
MMLREHTIAKDNLIEEKVKNKWTNHSLAVIKEIAKVWLDSNIAESVLLFFNGRLDKDLHSYMPIVSTRYMRNVPDVINYKIPGRETEILGIEPLKITSNSFRFKDAAGFIAGIMEDYLWFRNEVFILTNINTASFAGEHITIGRTAGTQRHYSRPVSRSRRETAEKKYFYSEPLVKKTTAKKSTAKKVTAKKTAVKKTVAKKSSAKKTVVKKLIAKKPAAKKKTTARKAKAL